MDRKLRVGVVNISHWFASKRDMELYTKAFFPSFQPKTPAPEQSLPPTLWIDEAVEYLGLDRLGLKRPDKAMHRLTKKGALHPKKVSGRLAFSREELDKVLANGDHKRGRGRPRKQG